MLSKEELRFKPLRVWRNIINKKFEEEGIKVSVHTIHRFLRKLGIRYGKTVL